MRFCGSQCVILILLSGLFAGLVAGSANAQQASQNPSPITDTTRPHPRIEKVEVSGRRTELAALKGAVLFAGPNVRNDKPVPLIIHFHGVSWLME